MKRKGKLGQTRNIERQKEKRKKLEQMRKRESEEAKKAVVEQD